MKIILINDTVYPYLKGGAQKRVYEIGTRLAKEHEVVWLAMQQWGKTKEIQQGGMTIKGVSANYKLYEHGRRTIKQAVYYALSLIPHLLFGRYEAVYCTNFPCFPAIVASVICAVRRKHLVMDVYEVWGLDYWLGYLGELGLIGFVFEWLTVRMVKHKVADGVHVAKMLKKELGVTAEAIAPDGINFDWVQSVKTHEEHYDVIYCGRLLAHKNLPLLLEALHLIKGWGRNVSCCIIGTGEQRAELERLARNYGLNVTFKGEVAGDDTVISLLKSAKLFTHPSLREGCGCTLPEANACGLMIAAVHNTHNSASDYIGTYQTGYLAENDIRDYAENILRGLCEDNHKARCIEISKRFDWAYTANTFRRLLVAKS